MSTRLSPGPSTSGGGRRRRHRHPGIDPRVGRRPSLAPVPRHPQTSQHTHMHTNTHLRWCFTSFRSLQAELLQNDAITGRRCLSMQCCRCSKRAVNPYLTATGQLSNVVMHCGPLLVAVCHVAQLALLAARYATVAPLNLKIRAPRHVTLASPYLTQTKHYTWKATDNYWIHISQCKHSTCSY